MTMAKYTDEPTEAQQLAARRMRALADSLTETEAGR